MRRQLAPAAPANSPVPGRMLQRKCACGRHTDGGECAACKRQKGRLQRHGAGGSAPTTAPPVIEEVLRSPGRTLDPSTRSFMEGRFGEDFSQVRIHVGDRPAESARAVNARAYTVGQHMVFGPGEYSPQTMSGRRLLAHELTHVVQQKSGQALQRQGLSIGPEHDAFEREADAFAESIGEERREHRAPTALPQPRIQRASAKEVFSQIPIIGALVEPLSRLFGEGDFSEEELQKYLDHLSTAGIEDHYDSDNKARAIVRLWKQQGAGREIKVGDKAITLTLELKVLLIEEMLSGFVSASDEEGISDLIHLSPASEAIGIVSRVRRERLKDHVKGTLPPEAGGEPTAQVGAGPLPAGAVAPSIPACANPEFFTEIAMPMFIPNSYLKGSELMEKSKWKSDLAAAQKNHCDAKGEFEDIELKWDLGNPALGTFYTQDLNKGSITFDLIPHLIYTGKPCCACLTGQVTWSFDIAIKRIKDGKTATGKTKAPLKGTKKAAECDGHRCCSVSQNLDISLSTGAPGVTFDISGKVGINGDVLSG